MKATLENLLCIIHRDGGQYISEHGIEKAFDDALEIHYKLRDAFEQQERYCAINEIQKDSERIEKNIKKLQKKYGVSDLEEFEKAIDKLKEKGITKENGLGYGY